MGFHPELNAPDARLVVEHQTTAILVLDESLRVCMLNQAAQALLAASESRLLGTQAETLFVDGSEDRHPLADALASQQPFTRRRAELRLPSEERLTVDYTVTPIVEERFTGLLVEIQALDRLLLINRDEQRQSVYSTTRELVRGLAHEIKNPLGGIRGAAQLLARELPREELREYTQIVIEETDRLRNLVDRMTGPIQRPHPQATSIHQIVERVIQLVDAEHPGRIRFERDYDPSLPDIEADPEQLLQAVLNIVRNAQQALEQTPDPTIILRTRILRQVTLGNRRHRLVVRLDIIDNGPGIPPEVSNLLFYPMISGRADGTGLGLSIAQSIVTAHGGVVECDSEPGETCFAVLIPLEQPDDKSR
jgi:two-component system nitrogen regulation sensor histidine kinase GlnL